ncbi:cytochrome c oxidase subunit II [Pelagovum pacificum]|uniref:Nitrous-oxide reductase n=1 Tax=Pelagovum pacificum TaxID=2588711 RepID=A0A5C5G974_9RHOB|nr:cytochrome c oxidase subunit II [Pelagovum pacificum]QQA41916.1 cytochrome c oxidase subunit II [Pelagovum pacificum]TNY30645.1 cytochrome c oxidase subunit II [Pelagovum pacificum]
MTSRRRATGRLTTGIAALAISGCSGPQSALSRGGEDASVLFTLFIVMLVAAVILWLLLNGAFFYVTRLYTGSMKARLANGMVIVCGILMPTVLIGILLAWGLSILPDQRQEGDGLTVRVRGEQWWWRIEYWPEGAEEPIIAANEIRMPVGERVEFLLDSDRVIHSFWIPSLGGKMDMFPGRETRMSLRAELPGTYRGQCAEFCGASHAWMAFEAVAMEPDDFDAWLEAEQGDAVAEAATLPGAAIFDREGCGACHQVRGTEHVGQVGPDLTHVGTRQTIGAGRMGASLENMDLWVRHTGDLKPEVDMPSYDYLSDEDAQALAEYLVALE